MLTGWNSVFQDGSWRRFPDTDEVTATTAVDVVTTDGVEGSGFRATRQLAPPDK